MYIVATCKELRISAELMYVLMTSCFLLLAGINLLIIQINEKFLCITKEF